MKCQLRIGRISQVEGVRTEEMVKSNTAHLESRRVVVVIV